VETGIPARLTPAEGRKFAFTVGAAFFVLAALTWWRDRELPMLVFGSLAAVLLVAGALIPGRLGPVYRAWMGLAHAISKVTTPIFMGIVYFVVLTPIGLAMRLVGRRPMVHKEHDGGFWRAAPSGGRADLERQF
jgi:hypothetical protein